MAEKKRRTGTRTRGEGLWTEGPGGLPLVKPLPGQAVWEAEAQAWAALSAAAKARLDAERAARTPDPDALTGWEDV